MADCFFVQIRRHSPQRHSVTEYFWEWASPRSFSSASSWSRELGARATGCGIQGWGPGRCQDVHAGSLFPQQEDYEKKTDPGRDSRPGRDSSKPQGHEEKHDPGIHQHGPRFWSPGEWLRCCLYFLCSESSPRLSPPLCQPFSQGTARWKRYGLGFKFSETLTKSLSPSALPFLPLLPLRVGLTMRMHHALAQNAAAHPLLSPRWCY